MVQEGFWTMNRLDFQYLSELKLKEAKSDLGGGLTTNPEAFRISNMMNPVMTMNPDTASLHNMRQAAIFVVFVAQAPACACCR